MYPHIQGFQCTRACLLFEGKVLPGRPTDLPSVSFFLGKNGIVVRITASVIRQPGFESRLRCFSVLRGEVIRSESQNSSTSLSHNVLRCEVILKKDHLLYRFVRVKIIKCNAEHPVDKVV